MSRPTKQTLKICTYIYIYIRMNSSFSKWTIASRTNETTEKKPIRTRTTRQYISLFPFCSDSLSLGDKIVEREEKKHNPFSFNACVWGIGNEKIIIPKYNNCEEVEKKKTKKLRIR